MRQDTIAVEIAPAGTDIFPNLTSAINIGKMSGKEKQVQKVRVKVKPAAVESASHPIR